METLGDLRLDLIRYLPAIAAMAATMAALWLANWILLRRKPGPAADARTRRQLLMLLLTGLGIVVIILALPVDTSTRNQLLTLLGLVLTAVIALSSTTFVANAMAGFMLRSLKNFRAGDFVRVGEQYGRVTERGLFHTEIQTEERNLTTLPNLYLMSHPFTVVRPSGTIVSATVSLGYDIPRTRIEPLLLEAARAAGLEEPFARVLDLGNYSVTYRVAGFLGKVKQLIGARSNLRRMVLDSLHGAGIEIVSPTFMNQRPLSPGTRVIPHQTGEEPEVDVTGTHGTPEDLVFDKAEHAQKIEELHAERERLNKEIAELEGRLSGASEQERSRLEREIERRRNRVSAIGKAIETLERQQEE